MSKSADNGQAKPRTKVKKIIIIVAIVLVICILALTLTYMFTIGYPAKYLRAKERSEKYQDLGFSEGQILLCGSSFIDYWDSAASDFAPLTTYNVGIAATVVSDWSKWIDLLIMPFKPRAIVLYVGSNDIHGGIGTKKGAAVAKEVRQLLDDIMAKLPETFIYYVSIAPTPLREKVWDQSNTCNKDVEAYCKTVDNLRFINCTDALLNQDGTLKPEIYRSDKLHFNEEGYRIWADTIVPILIAEQSLEADLIHY
ncbi:MAG: GDSL-type esterase/lipase family protein [Christensenellaceae bacterium]|jgi:lysophospholipase L1-like esterase|nr:GDSL-type esterase/lipase family protein [Christensenellaceae bacterium]